MTAIFNVLCMMCGRCSGQIRGGDFVKENDAPLPERDQNGHRCGFCGGNLFLEPDDSGVLPYAVARTLAERRAS